jgi:hypothetical protein
MEGGMNNELIERVGMVIRKARYTDGSVQVARLVLAELAGELRDAELSQIYRAERDRQEAFANNLLEALTAIHMLAAPSDVEVNGKIYSFKPDPAIYLEAWREMSKRIREIPKAIDEARG